MANYYKYFIVILGWGFIAFFQHIYYIPSVVEEAAMGCPMTFDFSSLYMMIYMFNISLVDVTFQLIKKNL